MRAGAMGGFKQAPCAVMAGLVALLAFALLKAAAAQPAGNAFPFGSCETSNAAAGIAVASVGNINGAGTTMCVNITQRACPSPANSTCCSMAAARFDIDIGPTCPYGANVSATLGSMKLNGITWVPAPGTTTPARTLRVTFPLPLSAGYFGAAGRQLCITVRGPCPSLDTLCEGAGCRVALGDAYGKCCPVTALTTYAPPPPPPPPPAACPTCLELTALTPMAANISKYNFTQADCKLASDLMVKGMTAIAANYSVPVTKPFAMTNCSSGLVRVCGGLRNEWDGKRMQDAVSREATAWLGQVMGACNSTKHLQEFAIRSSLDSNPACLAVAQYRQCVVLPSGFPNTTNTTAEGCSRATLALPKRIAPAVTVVPGRSMGARQFCFAVVREIPDTTTPGIPQACAAVNSTNIKSVDLFADYALHSKVTAVFLTAWNNATNPNPTPLPYTWRPVGLNTTLSISINHNLMYFPDSFCIELSGGVSLADLCNGLEQDVCYSTVLDRSGQCCPVYATHA